MDGNTTVKYLQTYLEQKDYSFRLLRDLPEGADREGQLARARQHCFLKLVEEVGEVSHAIFQGNIRQPGQPIKGTLDEELWDVMYYVLCLADLYGRGHGGGHPGKGGLEQLPVSGSPPL